MNDHVRLFSFRLCLKPDPSDIYTITSPDVPALVTEGRTPAEILTDIHDALDGLMEAWRELEMEIPPALRPILTDRLL